MPQLSLQLQYEVTIEPYWRSAFEREVKAIIPSIVLKLPFQDKPYSIGSCTLSLRQRDELTSPEFHGVPWIWSLYISEPFQKCSVGKELIKKCIESFPNHRIGATIKDDNLPSQKCFASLGFTKRGPSPKNSCEGGSEWVREVIV